MCHGQHDEDAPCPPPKPHPKGKGSGWDAWNQRSRKSFEARYAGRCQSCGGYFEEGDMIRYDKDDDLVHEDC